MLETTPGRNYRSVLRILIQRRASLVVKATWCTTSFRGPLPPHVIYYFLDNESGGDNLTLLSYRDLANFLNGCTPHDIHHIFHLMRLLVTARNLEDRLQSLFDYFRIWLRDKCRVETEASNARGERDVALAALQLISGQSTTSETSVVAQLRAELSAATDFHHQLVLQNDDLTGKVNELVQEQGRAQHYLRDLQLKRNAVTTDLASEQDL